MVIGLHVHVHLFPERTPHPNMYHPTIRAPFMLVLEFCKIWFVIKFDLTSLCEVHIKSAEAVFLLIWILKQFP